MGCGIKRLLLFSIFYLLVITKVLASFLAPPARENYSSLLVDEFSVHAMNQADRIEREQQLKDETQSLKIYLLSRKNLLLSLEHKKIQFPSENYCPNINDKKENPFATDTPELKAKVDIAPNGEVFTKLFWQVPKNYQRPALALFNNCSSYYENFAQEMQRGLRYEMAIRERDLEALNQSLGVIKRDKPECSPDAALKLMAQKVDALQVNCLDQSAPKSSFKDLVKSFDDITAFVNGPSPEDKKTQAQQEVFALAASTFQNDGIKTTKPPEAYWQLRKKWQEAGVAANLLDQTWQASKMTFLSDAIKLCLQKNPHASVWGILNSGLAPTIPEEALRLETARVNIFPEWIYRNLRAGKNSTLDNFKQSPHAKFLKAEDFINLTDVFAENKIIAQKRILLEDWQSKNKSCQFIQKLSQHLFNQNADVSGLNEKVRACSREMKELNDKIKLFGENNPKFLNQEDLKKWKSALLPKLKDQVDAAFAQFLQDNPPPKMKSDEWYTKLGKSALRMVEGAVDITMGNVLLYGGTLATFSWESGLEASAALVDGNRRLMNHMGVGSVLGNDQELMNMNGLEAMLRINPVVQFGGVISSGLEGIEEGYLHYAGWKSGIGREAFLEEVQRGNAGAAIPYYSFQTAKAATGLALTLSTAGAAGSGFAAQSVTAAKIVGVSGGFSLVSSVGTEMSRWGDQGGNFSVGNVAHNTARGTADGTLFLGTMARGTSLIGKTSGGLSKAHANKILATRANTALGIGLSTSAGDMPHLVDMWKENPGNFSSTFGRVMQTSTAAFGLGGTTLVSGVYGRIRGTSAKMSAKNIEELSERLPNEMRFSSPEEFLQKIQLLKFADDVAGKKVASIEEAQQIQDKILEATLWNDGEPVMNLKLAEKIIEEHNNPQIIPKAKNITLTVEKKNLTELDLRRIKTEVDLVPTGRLQKNNHTEFLSHALAEAKLPTISKEAQSFIITKNGYVKKTLEINPPDAIGEFHLPKVEMAAPKMDAKSGQVDRVWLMSKLHEQFKGQFTIEQQFRSGGMKEAYVVKFKDEFGREQKLVVKVYSPSKDAFLSNRNKDFTEAGAEILQRDLAIYDYLVEASKETKGRVRVAEILSRDMPDLTRYGIVVQEYLPDKNYKKVTEKTKNFSDFDRFYEKHEVGLYKCLIAERSAKKMEGVYYQGIDRIRQREKDTRFGAAIDLGVEYGNLRQRKLPDGSIEYVFIDY